MIYWKSMSDFWAMGGYGLYVWGSFVVCVAALLLEQVLLKRRTQAIVRSLRRRARAERMDRELA
jgi:heme exporter protein D